MDRYDVDVRLGDGTYGSVWKATKKQTSEVVSNSGEGFQASTKGRNGPISPPLGVEETRLVLYPSI